ncbi:MAG: hypothetical protein JO306_07375 [Gemmatimonadetes bacterium]|nr:hypothetical protein [Gemmatimonadota bacterium]
MIRKLIAAAALVLAPALAHAQQTTAATAANAQMQQSPGVLVVSLQKCRFATMDQLDGWWRANAAPILNQLVHDGKLQAWGVFEHAWGDEWNWGIYYVAKDLPTFHSSFDQFFGTLHQRQPQFMQTFEQYCSEHKDNIYDLAMTEMSTGGGMQMPMAPRP